ncbi:hypothetical protein [Streptacidiphilus fuscans]|uniref:Uncharacterized protein n=1 Tax=Streptacidiphilus fuscans TaxID=2789292 RepID=A0A931B5W5_9ACTN|nr:hypothetical protein [Streptacidiphilus fuscans]MBF9071800.1 hypothetical protein [Streptacidiphilus fuscans]
MLADWADDCNRDLTAMSHRTADPSTRWPDPGSLTAYAMAMQHITELVTAVAAHRRHETTVVAAKRSTACLHLGHAGTSLAWGLRKLAPIFPTPQQSAAVIEAPAAMRLRLITAEALRTAARHLADAATQLRTAQHTLHASPTIPGPRSRQPARTPAGPARPNSPKRTAR